MKRSMFLMIFFFTVPVYGLRIILMNDAVDIVLNKRVSLKFLIQEGELGIVKNTLQFSVDHPDISLVAWNSSTVPNDYFSSSRKRTQAIYSEPFTGCLSLEYKHDNHLQENDLFAETKLYVSCFVIRSNGKTKPMSTMLALGVPVQGLPVKAEQPGTISGHDLAYPVPELMPVQNFEKDFEPIEHLGVLWNTFCKKLTETIFGKAFFWWHWLVVVLFFTYALKRRLSWLRFIAPLQGRIERDFMIMLWFLLMSGLLYRLHFFMQGGYILYAFAALCCVVMLYIFLTSAREDFFLSRLKNLIGIIVGSMILPIMLKAYLMHHGL